MKNVVKNFQGNREIAKIVDEFKKHMEEEAATVVALEEQKVKMEAVSTVVIKK